MTPQGFVTSIDAAASRAASGHADHWLTLCDRVDAAPWSADVAIVAAICALIAAVRITERGWRKR